MEIRQTLPYPDDPRLLRIGREFAKDAHALAHELESYGADAMALMDEQRFRERESGTIEIQTVVVDALMALLLSLRRKGEPGRRSPWSKARAQALLDSGMSKNEAAALLSEETGLPELSIRRRLQDMKKGGGVDK
jgi:hypothetical protein